MNAPDVPLFSEADATLTRRVGIVDLHNDLAVAILKERFDGTYDSLRSYWLPRLRAGGVKVVVCPVYLDSVYLPEAALRRAMQIIDALYIEITDNADQIALVRSPEDLEAILTSDRIAAVLSFEGAEPLGQDLSALRLFYQLGLRMLSFTWMRRTAFGDGTWEVDSPGGLSRLGRAAVKEMNRLGIIPDVSHASDQTAWDILTLSDQPVIASHSNARAVHSHPRNLTDDLIRAIAASGGVIGVVAVAKFVTDGPPTIAQWVDHIDHLVHVAGIDHVSVGADFAHYLYAIGASQGIAEWNPYHGAPSYPFSGMLGPEDLPGLTPVLLARGYHEADLRKIYRDNALRVLAGMGR